MNLHPPSNLKMLPRLVFAGAFRPGKRSLELFRDMGWVVQTARTGSAARRLSRQLRPTAVILSSELLDESGWLACAKLRFEFPDQLVILTAPKIDAETVRFAQFVGAKAVVHEDIDPIDLMLKLNELLTQSGPAKVAPAIEKQFVTNACVPCQC